MLAHQPFRSTGALASVAVERQVLLWTASRCHQGRPPSDLLQGSTALEAPRQPGPNYRLHLVQEKPLSAAGIPCATGLRNVLKTPFIIIASPLCFRFFPLVSQAIKRDLGSASRYAACCFYEVGAVSAQAADISQLVGDTLPGF